VTVLQTLTRPTDAAAAQRRRIDLATIVLALVTAAGCGVRIALWWQDRAFWRDELSLVQSLDTYSVPQLFGQLTDAQTAPPLWLVLVKASTWVFGDGERGYRVLPLLFGCATLVLLAVLAARLVKNRWAAVVPVIVLSTVSELVFYTAQTKQYTADTFLVVGLILLAVHVLQTGKGERLWYVALVIAPWFSYGAMLSIPFLAVWLAVVQLRRRQRGAAYLAMRIVVPAVSVLGAALLSWRLTSHVNEFTSYWDYYLGPENLAHTLRWTIVVFKDLAIRELGSAAWWATGLLVMAGFAIALRRGVGIAVMLVLPTAAGYLAGLLGIYPFGHRLILFCAPGLAVLLAILVDAVAERAGRLTQHRYAKPAAGVVVAAIVLATSWTTPQRLTEDLTYQFGVDDYRSAFAFVAKTWDDSDVLIVGNGDRAAARVYGPRFDLPMNRILRASPTEYRKLREDCPIPELRTPGAQFWFVTGDAVKLYNGVSSRTAIVAPFVPTHHVVNFRVSGLVTVQAMLPGRNRHVWPTRCLQFHPVTKPVYR
jgi:hypothetical protein